MANTLPMFEDELDALRDLVQALGGAKKVGGAMRPELSVEAAAQWLRDCLNRDRRERFDPAHVVLLLRMGRAAGYHAAKHWLDLETGYEPSAPLEPEDARAKLQREFIASVELQRQLLERLERLGGATVVRAVK
jgi:hypothetical protein